MNRSADIQSVSGAPREERREAVRCDVLLADLVLEAQCRAPEEIHDLAALVFWRREAEAAGHTDAAAKIERALRAFVARRKLGTPVTIKGVRAEFVDSANDPSSAAATEHEKL